MRDRPQFAAGPKNDQAERREGDPPELVADPSKAKKVLDWEAEYRDVREIIGTAWKWMSGPRKGRYEK